MNILYINHYAGSPIHGMEYRPYYLAREWVSKGHRVRVLAASFSHVRARQPINPDGNALKLATLETIDGVEYEWYPTPSYSGNSFGRVKNILFFLYQVWRDAPDLAIKFKPDVVIASSTYPMDIWVARRIAKLSNAKLVFEIHDLWPLSPIEIGGMSRLHPFILWCQVAENTAYRVADLVVSMLPNVSKYVAMKGLPLDRLVIIPNGISLEDWSNEEPTSLREDIHVVINMAKKKGHLIVVYTGSHGLPNALDNLLDAASILRNEKLTFILVGDGHERKRLLERCYQELLSNVYMFMPVPKAQLMTLLKLVDMAYLGAPKHPIYRFGVSPNKMIDYMMGRVPILYAIEAGNNPVAEANCGLSISAEAPRDLAKSILDLASLPPITRIAMGENGRSYVLSHHTYNPLAKKFLSAVMKTGVRN